MSDEIEKLREELAEANARRNDLRTALEWANEERDRLQRERDEARAEARKLGDALTQETRLSIAMARQRDEARREADRLRHGNTVEGDFVCPNELAAKAATMARDSIEKMIRFELRAQQEEGAQEACRRVVKDRDEARAEVERLAKERDGAYLQNDERAGQLEDIANAIEYEWCDINNDDVTNAVKAAVKAAYRRGAEAMREACAVCVAHLSHEDGLGMGSQRIEGALRALPIPEDKP